MVRVFSGIQPTGALHLGNYFGAIRNWVALQERGAAGAAGECLYCIVDYHAITVEYEPRELNSRCLGMAMDLLACGIDPERSILFLQSQVSEQAELAWILSCVASYGDLLRMIQFKDKAGKGIASAGLLTYPVLMAADLLAYQATHAPVGEDQLQHLELARELARRFNRRFGELFPEPAALLTAAPRIMSLADPGRKMSKSAGDKHYVGLFESAESMARKIRLAVTDTGGSSETSAGVNNLLLILEQVAEPEVLAPLRAAEREGRLKYSELKEIVSRRLLDFVAPLRERRARIREGDARDALKAGGRKAVAIAAPVLEKVRARMGMLIP